MIRRAARSTTSLTALFRRCRGEGLGHAAERAELPDDWRKHDLRHRRVTTWLSEGHSPLKVQKALGHSDLKTTMGYYTFVRSDLESLVAPEEAEKREIAQLKNES